MLKTKIRRFLEIYVLYKNWIEVSLARYRKKPINFVRLKNKLKFYTGSIPSARPTISHTFSKREGYDIYQRIKKGDIVIDIGAFIGDFSIKAANQGAKVYAYEPCKETFVILKKNISINNLENKIFPFNLGIDKKKGKDKLTIREDAGVNSMIGGDILACRSKTIGSEIIKLITFEQMMKSNKLKGCDFLKIDTEGTEYGIIMSIPLKILKKIKYISMESTDYAETGTKNKKLVKHLEKNGFNVKKGFEMKYFDELKGKFSKESNQNVMRIYAKNENKNFKKSR